MEEKKKTKVLKRKKKKKTKVLERKKEKKRKRENYRPSASFIKLQNSFLSLIKEHSSSLNLTLHEVSPFISYSSSKYVLI